MRDTRGSNTMNVINYLAVCLLALTSGSNFTSAVRAQAPAINKAILYKKVNIPEQLLGTMTTRNGKRIRFGGDVRIGDLTGNGRADLLVFRSVDGGMKPSFLGAFTLDGNILWTVGEGGQQPNRPGPVAIHDIDGDGQAEVICLFVDGDKRRHWKSLENVVLQIRDGATGKVERQSAPTTIRQHGQPGPPRTNPKLWNDHNWVHQRILIADLQGNKNPQDFIIKFGQKVFALDNHLRILWCYDIPKQWQPYGRHTAYIPAVGDIDKDGKDEILGGYFLLDDDGTPLWEKELGPHMDSVAITAWDQGHMRAICSGHGHVLDARGRILLKLGKQVPHGQEVRVADFVAESPGPEMIIRYNGHQRGVKVITNNGEIRKKFDLNESANNTGMEVVYWNGKDQPALLCNGGVLWTADGLFLRLPGLPPPIRPVQPRECPGWRMAWYHTIPANLCGDDREEVLLYNPWDTSIFIYTPIPFRKDAYTGYHPEPRQYNARLMD